MVRSNVCPRCLGTMDGYYVEEGDVIIAIAVKKLVCADCGFSFEGIIDEE